MVSLKDISKVCGVSIATVSKALNNHSDISEETKAHIKQVAKEMGYFPNLSARALKTNKTNGIGVLFVDAAGSGLTHDYFAAILDSFKRMAEKKGYDITFINSYKDREERMTYLEHCRYRGFDGVALACIDFDDPEVIELVQSDIPLVTIDHIFNNRTVVTSDNILGIRSLVEYIYGMGHKKIAYIHGADSAVTRNRISAFYRAVEALGLVVPDEYVEEAEYRDTHSVYLATKKILELDNRPTCIMFPDDFSAFGGINAIREKGLRIPEDISIVGYDGIPATRYLEPQLTTIKQDTEQMGCIAARRLIGLIEKPKTALVEQIVVPGTLVEGKSVAKLK